MKQTMVHLFHLRPLALALLLGMASPLLPVAFGQSADASADPDPAAGEAAPDKGEEGDEQVDPAAGRELVRQLGHSKYETREAAQKKLEALPAGALPIVAEAYRASDDPEVRMRLRAYGQAFFLKHELPRHGIHPPAFLGVSQTTGFDPDGQAFIEVVQVIDGTAAQRAGIKPGDRIIALDGRRVDRADTVTQFSEAIKAHQPGKTVTLTIIRDSEPIDIDATLGAIPERYMPPEMREDIGRRINELQAAWLAEHFAADSQSD
jgi:membrane-associated protease RseP (regulator of RpoE activity)